MEDLSSDTQVHANPVGLVLSIITLLCAFLSSAQELSTSNKKALKLYQRASKDYKERDFDAALEHLEQASKIDATFFEAFARMGNLYNALGKMDSVYSKYEKYLKAAPKASPPILEKMAFMAFDRGHYNRSEAYLQRLLQLLPLKAQEREIQLLQKSHDFASKQVKKPDTISITELPFEVNRFDLQYLPAMTVDKSMLIYTKRDHVTDDEDIVVSHFADGKWMSAQSVSSRINTSLNEGACTISADGRMMIFTACDRRDSFGSCDLFISKRTGDSWSKPKNLGRSINSKYWESQPSLSADGKKLFFVSNRPGGFGGRDIWVSSNVNGKWEAPENLGNQINTFKDETTPFIHFSGESLFFSSNGYPGMGGFDLFKSRRSDTVWTEPKNLGFPINSFRDEVALLVGADGKMGYYAKEVQKDYEILDSKIVSFNIPKSDRPVKSAYIVGRVLDEEDHKPLRASIQVVDLITEETFYDNVSDSVTGEFYMVLPRNKELGGYIKKKGYLYKDFSFNTGSTNADSLVIELSKIEVGKSLILRNIYFETNSFQLTEKSKVEIKNAVNLLEENTGLFINIEGHTDNIGDITYNLDLSDRRAQEVYNAIRNSGIQKKRLSYKGFGSSMPLKPNSSEENRQYNRRIEFRVLRTEQ